MTKNKTPKTPVEEASEIVRASGNSFHASVLRYLREQGWSVFVSAYYADSSAGKSREVDLVAEKAFPVVKDAFGHVTGTINARLFIECKYVKQTTVFWMHRENDLSTMDLLERAGFRRENTFTKQHHYFHGPVAKLFSGSVSDVPTEQEQMFRALNQTLNSLIALRRLDRLVPDLPDRSGVRHVLTYPVIVCDRSDRFFCVDMDKSDDPPRPAPERFLFEINYAWLNSANNNVTEYFLVDVATLDGLPALLASIAADAGVVGQFHSKS